MSLSTRVRGCLSLGIPEWGQGSDPKPWGSSYEQAHGWAYFITSQRLYIPLGTRALIYLLPKPLLPPDYTGTSVQQHH